MTKQELLDLVYLGKELRNLEYKCSINWNDDNTKLIIFKSFLAMSNIKDGGFLILGVENESFSATGMSKEDYDSFNYDDISAQISRCADPYIEFDMEKLEDSEKLFIIFIIKEFDEIPVICKSGGPDNSLKVGSLYTRTHRILESAPVSNQTELREIIDIATDKSLRKYIQKSITAGLIKVAGHEEDDREQFENQIRDLL